MFVTEAIYPTMIRENLARPLHPNTLGLPDYYGRFESSEKSRFKNFLSALAGVVIPKTDQPALVAGVGSGDELFHLLSSKIPRIIGYDIAPKILEQAAVWFEKWKNVELMQGNLTDMSAIPDNSISFSVASSVIHEVDSYEGPEGTRKAIAQLQQKTAPNGMIVWREFLPDFGGSGFLTLKTPRAQEFMEHFDPAFYHGLDEQGQREEWRKIVPVNGNQVWLSSRYASELIRHFVFHARNYKGYYRNSNGTTQTERDVFKQIDDRSWEELHERYSLARNGTTYNDIPDLLTYLGFSNEPWSYAAYTVVNSEDDEFMNKHFSLQDKDGREAKLTDRRLVTTAIKGTTKNRFDTVKKLARAFLPIDYASEQPEVYCQREINGCEN